MPLSRARLNRPAAAKLACGAPIGSCDFGQIPGARPASLHFDALANSIDQMIWSMRPDGSHDYFNARWYEYTGLREDTADKSAWKTCIHPDDLDGIRQRWALSLQSGEPYETEFRLRHVSGQFRWVIGRARPARDEDGNVARWFGTCTDVHELKTVQQDLAAKEAQLREWNETLEQRVAARSAELADVQNALRQSQKLDAMGQITGGVAHDLNNLLTPIFGGLDIIQRRGVGAGDERLQRLISGAIASAERARTLVQRLLAFARRQPLSPAPVSLCDLMTDLRQILATTLSPRVQIHIDVPGSLPYVQADLNQLEVAILNLAVNARDAMPNGGDLHIAAKLAFVQNGEYPGVASGFYVRMSVVDNGCGMDAETLARAVEPFFTTKGVGRGTGLGLSMAHGLVAQLGGVLTIESKPGAGATVAFLLPTANSPFVEAPEVVDFVGAVAPGRVLLADDEDDVRASVAQMFEHFGQEVVEAASAEEAMALLEAGEKFSLVVTDHLMPGMSGVELTRHIRALWPEQKLLIVSGYADLADVAAGIPRLPKPFRHADLARLLPTLLPRDAMAGGAP